MHRLRDTKQAGSATLSAQNSVVVHIAHPYATALFDIAGEGSRIAEIESSLDAVAGLIAENREFADFLRSPVISGEDKAKAMDAILAKAKTPKMVANFIRAVALNRRLFALPEMIALFKQMTAKARGEISAEVTSASALSKTQLKSLADTLKKRMGKTVTLQTHIDPELIGGLVVKVGSQMIDSSLRTKLSAMKIAMKEVG